MAEPGNAREVVLGRIAQALRTPSPSPWPPGEPGNAPTGPWFPLPELSEPALRERFRDEFIAIQGTWIEVASISEANQRLQAWIAEQGWQKILAQRSPRIEQLIESLPGVVLVDGENCDIAGWDQYDLGITGAESLVAESGTIVVSAGLSGRALSVLPPVHLVLATADQLVPDLETSMARLRRRYPGGLPSTLSWVSGPSRTADIEKILVLGAHGPRILGLMLLPAATPS